MIRWVPADQLIGRVNVMSPSKPHWFNFRDLLFPGSVAIVAVACLILVLLAGDLQSATPGKELPTGIFGVQGLFAFVALVTTGIYIAVLWIRHLELSRFVYVRGPYYAVMVNPGSFKGDISSEAVMREFQSAFDHWSQVFTHETVWRLANDDVFWVWLKPTNLVEKWNKSAKVAGYTVSRSRRVVVGYATSNDRLSETPLQHEIGHVIQGEITGDWTESVHHALAQERGIR